MIETNKIYLGNSYELINQIPDNSVDLIYTDIPYDFVGNGGGGAFREKKRDYHKEYEQVIVNTESSGLHKRKAKNSSEMTDIVFGIDWKILDEFVRVQPLIYIYGVVKNKYLI